APLGLRWDSVNYSCDYDATFTILFNIWLENTSVWSEHFQHFSPLLSVMQNLLTRPIQEQPPLEQVRDTICAEMYHLKPTEFPYGP
ncbi:hypothetical protein B0H17DRAFT_886180, partial [Mycena rosella]